MRMWNVDPALLCRQHLLGEHVEMHMFEGCCRRGKSLAGYIGKGLVELGNINNRHDELVTEMERRGYNHKSPLAAIRAKPEGRVDIAQNIADLCARCPDCRERVRRAAI